MLDEQLCNLDGVESSALAQVIAGDNEHEALVIVHRLVLADAADQGLVDAGGGERSGDCLLYTSPSPRD